MTIVNGTAVKTLVEKISDACAEHGGSLETNLEIECDASSAIDI